MIWVIWKRRDIDYVVPENPGKSFGTPLHCRRDLRDRQQWARVVSSHTGTSTCPLPVERIHRPKLVRQVISRACVHRFPADYPSFGCLPILGGTCLHPDQEQGLACKLATDF